MQEMQELINKANVGPVRVLDDGTEIWEDSAGREYATSKPAPGDRREDAGGETKRRVSRTKRKTKRKAAKKARRKQRARA